jgi:hypothetical protein
VVGHRPGGHAVFDRLLWDDSLREENPLSSEKIDWSAFYSRKREWLEDIVPLPDRRSVEENAMAGHDRRTTPDRRGACRYPARRNQARLGWWESQELHTAFAHLVDISQTGSLAVTNTLPPENARIAICLDAPVPANWVEATIEDIPCTSEGSHQVRLKFTEYCPNGFFKAAVGGLEGEADRP